MEKLSERHELVLRLREEEGYPFAEIAEALKVSTTRAQQLYKQASRARAIIDDCDPRIVINRKTRGAIKNMTDEELLFLVKEGKSLNTYIPGVGWKGALEIETYLFNRYGDTIESADELRSIIRRLEAIERVLEKHHMAGSKRYCPDIIIESGGVFILSNVLHVIKSVTNSMRHSLNESIHEQQDAGVMEGSQGNTA